MARIYKINSKNSSQESRLKRFLHPIGNDKNWLIGQKCGRTEIISVAKFIFFFLRGHHIFLQYVINQTHTQALLLMYKVSYGSRLEIHCIKQLSENIGEKDWKEQWDNFEIKLTKSMSWNSINDIKSYLVFSLCY